MTYSVFSGTLNPVQSIFTDEKVFTVAAAEKKCENQLRFNRVKANNIETRF